MPNDKKKTPDSTPQSEQTPDEAAPGGSAPHDQGENGEEMANNDAENEDETPAEDDRGPIDPITNQPLSDFMPSASGKDADKVAILAAAQTHNTQTAAANRNAIEESLTAGEANKQAIKDAKRNLERVQTTTEEMMAIAGAVNPAIYQARERAKVAAEALSLGTNETVPGGKFKVNGRWVNAEGEPLND